MLPKSPLRLIASVLFLALSTGRAAPAHTERNILYLTPSAAAAADPYRKQSCVLDVYVPADAKDCPVIVWFHGGGLREGSKSLPVELMNKGYCIVSPNYRLTPKAKAINAVEDAAAAVSWVFENIHRYGGSHRLIFLSGHSAGGYLSTMVTLDPKWLQPYGIDSDLVAGLIPFSGQMITHAAVRGERDIPATRPTIDALAPLFHVRADTPPFLMITGDRELELWGRYEECAYMARMMKIVGNHKTHLVEIPGVDHGSMVKPAFPLLIDEVNRVVALRAAANR